MYILIKRIIRLFLLSLFAAWMVTAASAEGEWQKYELPAGDTAASPYMHYWVYTPEDLKPGLPLIVYLHSTAGMVNSALKECEGGLPSMIVSGEIPAPEAVVLVPQHPGTFDDFWDKAVDSVVTCVDKVIEEYDVDRSRIVLTGYSLGGIGMWDLVAARPGIYSRLLCVEGKVNRKSQHPELFEGCEVLVYTAHLDLAINSATAINFVDRLNEAGIQAEHIQLENTHQEVPKIVYTDKAVQEWIWLVDPDNEKGPEESPVP